MCGIAGIVDYSRPSSFYLHRLEKLKESLRHRGPDDYGLALLTNVGIVHTRLSIIDLGGSRQPLTSPDGRLTLTYNGEIYNYKELRKQLFNQWSFKTIGEAEVILAAWSKWGFGSLARFNGMFAFFIWDAELDQGFLVRDRLGIKPAVYRFENGVFEFASEAKALVNTDGRGAKANEHSVLEYLAAPFFSGVSASMFANIEVVQPGEIITVTRDHVRRIEWSDFILDPIPGCELELREVLQESVRNALVSDVPIGAFLSGGFDSTLIAAIAKAQGSDTLQAYTVTFPEQARFDYSASTMTNSDDTPYALRAARELELKHELVLADRESLPDRLRRIAISNDALPAWEQELAQDSLAAAAACRYKAVLVGDAADETHYGYHFLLDAHATSAPRALISRFVNDTLINEARLSDPAQYFDEYYTKFINNRGYNWESSDIGDTLATTCLIIKRWLPRLLHNGDIHTMASSLEARVPFADNSLLDLARRIHPQIAYQNGFEKWWLRQCSKGLLPESIRMRKKSALPKDQNVGAIYLKELQRIVEQGNEVLNYFLDMEGVRRLCRSHVVIDESTRALMFRVICLHHWSQHYGVQV